MFVNQNYSKIKSSVKKYPTDTIKEWENAYTTVDIVTLILVMTKFDT